MPGKAVNFSLVLRQNLIVHWWFKILMVGLFLGISILWGIDGLNMSSSLQKDFVVLKVHDSENSSLSREEFSSKNLYRMDLNYTHQSFAQERKHLEPDVSSESLILSGNQSYFSNYSTQTSANLSNDKEGQFLSTSLSPSYISWVSAELEANYSSNLLAKWMAPGGDSCKDSRAVDIKIFNFDDLESFELSTGDLHGFLFQSVDDSGKPICSGGDYFEIDLSGETWKSRPPVRDNGNGTYTFSLQVHPDFAGDYNLTIILLFRHYEGLKSSPPRFVFDKVLRTVPIRFLGSTSQLSEIGQCQKSDFKRDVWSGRWTRHARNDSCPISRDGRYRCQEPSFPCQHPWCYGPLGALESNGWIYSSHCSFKLFMSDEAWNCLNQRWIFWWGDSNHCDTIRNILHFILDVQDIPTVPRIFDMNITNPRNQSQMVRFTSIFNGHHNHTSNYQGLNSLINEEYREKLKAYFSEDVLPDTVIMNSGLHDGVYWSNLRNFIKGADYAAAFWAEVMEGVRKRGLVPPEIIYRTTVTTGGYARSLAFNPSKMEAYNGVVLDKLKKYGILDRVIDDFDMTYPWHYDNRCNDGVHYGRAPSRTKWRDGQIGHQYFVDLMLGHVLINALCAV